MRFEQFEIFLDGRQSAAGGNDRFGPAAKFLNNRRLKGAKRRFAVAGENVADAASRAGFDHFVGIHVSIVQKLGDKVADGRFAGAHEADQSKIDGMTHVYTVLLPDFAVACTLQIPNLDKLPSLVRFSA